MDKDNINTEEYRLGRRSVSKMETKAKSVTQAIELYVECEDCWSRSFKRGFLDGISIKLDHLLEEVRSEKILIELGENENGESRTGADGTEGEGSSLRGDGDVAGETGGAEEESSDSDGSDKRCSE